MKFRDKVVLVTGASGGIGQAIVLAFASEGAKVALHFNTNQEGIDELTNQLENNSFATFKADISIPHEVEQLIANVVDTFGTIDILINNAAAIIQHPIMEVDYEAWNNAWSKTLNVNLQAIANTSYCAIQHMMKHGGGRIVNVSSRGAFRGEPDMPAYGASKAGLNALGQSLALAVAKYKIYISTVAPGFVDTDRVAPFLNGKKGDAIRAQSPLNRVAKKEEVANAILFLASEEATFSTGAILDINGASYLRS